MGYGEKPIFFEFLIHNLINLRLLYLCIKSELEELRDHKVVAVILQKFDRLLLSS